MELLIAILLSIIVGGDRFPIFGKNFPNLYYIILRELPRHQVPFLTLTELGGGGGGVAGG